MIIFLELIIGLSILIGLFSLLIAVSLKKRVYVAILHTTEYDDSTSTHVVGVFYKREMAESTLYQHSKGTHNPSAVVECIVNRVIDETEPPKGALPLK